MAMKSKRRSDDDEEEESSGFKYRGRDARSVKAFASRGSGSYDSYLDPRVQRFKVSDGENNIRVLPPSWKDMDTWGDQWGIEVWVHNNIGPDNSQFLCLYKMKGETCPICEARRELDDEEEAGKLKPTKRIVAYLIDRDNPKDGPLVWAMPWGQVAREISSRSIKKKTGEVILIDDPDAGYDVTFERTGSGKQTKYIGVDISREESPISENSKEQQKWLEFIQENQLPDVLKYHEPDYMEKVYMGKISKKDEDEEEDDDEDEKPKRKRSRDEDEDEKPSRKSKKGKSRDEEEEEEEEEKEEEEDEDEKPSKKSKSKSKDEEEEEEEDEKPSKKSKSKDEDEEEEEEEEEEDEKPSAKAKKSVERLKRKRK